MTFRPEVRIATDGAISYTHGPGGWACTLESNGHTKEFTGIKEVTTNQALELEAVIQALYKLSRSCRVTVFSDSEYVVKNFTKGYVKRWEKNGWCNARGKPIANKEQWETLLALSDLHDLQFVWVRGHDGNALNERADELAVQASLLAKETFPESLERAKEGYTPKAEVKEAQEPVLTFSEAVNQLRKETK